MSLQTEAMRFEADRSYSAFKDNNGDWHGIEHVNHPTPSGCDRWLMTYSDNRSWPNKKTAIAKIKEACSLADEKIDEIGIFKDKEKHDL